MTKPEPLLARASDLQIELVDDLCNELMTMSCVYASGTEFTLREDIEDEFVYECEDGRQFRVDLDLRVTQIGGQS